MLVTALSLAVGLPLGVARLGIAPTRIVVYSPFAPDGSLAQGVRIAGSAAGSCWEGSIESERPDAWRCTVGNFIHDPCYSGAVGWVACPSAIFGKRVLRINLSKPLPDNMNRTLNTNKVDPLSIVLSGGVHCSFTGGATGTVAGMRLNYTCSNGAWLVGDPDRQGAAWRILSLASLKASHASPVPIVTAWF
jgi:hypothetical protein